MIYLDNKELINSEAYKEFKKNNPEYGNLKIRVYTASEAIPISNLKVTITTKIGNDNVVFYEGYSDESGVIENISLPAPKLDLNNLDVPKSIIYEILATYVPDNVSKVFKVNIYENVTVIQNINISLIKAGDLWEKIIKKVKQ